MCLPGDDARVHSLVRAFELHAEDRTEHHSCQCNGKLMYLSVGLSDVVLMSSMLSI